MATNGNNVLIYVEGSLVAGTRSDEVQTDGGLIDKQPRHRSVGRIHSRPQELGHQPELAAASSKRPGTTAASGHHGDNQNPRARRCEGSHRTSHRESLQDNQHPRKHQQWLVCLPRHGRIDSGNIKLVSYQVHSNASAQASSTVMAMLRVLDERPPLATVWRLRSKATPLNATSLIADSSLRRAAIVMSEV